MGSQRQLVELVGQIYDSAMDPTGWQNTLARLMTRLRADVGNFFIWDNTLQRPSFYTFHGGEQQGALEYGEYFGAIDPHTRLIAELPVGAVMNCADHFNQDYVDRSEFYQDFYRKYGMRWLLGMRTASFDGQDGYLGIMRCPGRPFDEKDNQLYRDLFPHLQRATHILHRLRLADFQAAMGLAALDRLAQATLIVEGSGGVVYANPSAETLLREGGCLTLNHGRLTAMDTARRERLSQLIAGAVAVPKSDSMRLDRGCGKAPLTLTALPLAPHSPLALPWARPMALVFVSDPDKTPADTAAQWRQLYGFSPAETRLAEALVGGSNPSEYAQTHGVTLNTVRTQLKALLAKTGTRRQAELVRLLIG